MKYATKLEEVEEFTFHNKYLNPFFPRLNIVNDRIYISQ